MAARRPWISFSFLIAAGQALQGCYVYVPLQSPTPAVGEAVQLQINDRGRVELGERLGPGVRSVSGRVTGVVEDQLALNVSSVRYVSGENSVWTGEAMRFSRSYVSFGEVRQLSKGRTWTVAGIATVAVVGFIATRGLSAIFGGHSEDGTPDPPASFRLDLGFRF